MVKVYIIRHAQSELNLLKIETCKKFGLTLDESPLVNAYKVINDHKIVDALLTELGEAQSKICRLENQHKFGKVN